MEVASSLLAVVGGELVAVVLVWLVKVEVVVIVEVDVVVVVAGIAAVVLVEVEVVVLTWALEEVVVDCWLVEEGWEVVSGLTGPMGGPRFVDASTRAPGCATTK